MVRLSRRRGPCSESPGSSLLVIVCCLHFGRCHPCDIPPQLGPTVPDHSLSLHSLNPAWHADPDTRMPWTWFLPFTFSFYPLDPAAEPLGGIMFRPWVIEVRLLEKTCLAGADVGLLDDNWIPKVRPWLLQHRSCETCDVPWASASTTYITRSHRWIKLLVRYSYNVLLLYNPS